MQSHASRVRRQAARRSKQISATSRAAASSAMSTLSISKNRNVIGAAGAGAAEAGLGGRRKVVARRSSDGLEKKIRMLQRLIPDREPSDDDLEMDGLFREAVDYILCLEMKARVMKIMVDVLSPSQD